MSNLKVLKLRDNQIKSIPEWIGCLKFLERFDVSVNLPLQKLHKSLLSLPLTELKAEDCVNAIEPPHYVCEGGLESIRQYYTDSNNGNNTMVLATIAVIGRKMAGKTSLVKSLHAKQIVPTYRTDNSQSDFVDQLDASYKSDETTKVFNFLKTKLLSYDKTQNGKTVSVIDFGGDEIYHHAYQLTFRKDCIPIVVVNIIQYEDESRLWGRREASRRVVFDWIAHLYLACPSLERPLLVLTHKDRAKERFKQLKSELLATINELHRELLHENSLDVKIECMKNASVVGFFLDTEITEVQHGAAYSSVFSELEDIICERVRKSEISVPTSWTEIMDSIKSRPESHLNMKELFSGLSEDSLQQRRVILEFMKRSGQILSYADDIPLGDDRHIDSSNDSYEDYDDFSDYSDDESRGRRLRSWLDLAEPEWVLDYTIFHNVSKVTDMVKRLFDHSSAEHKSVLKEEELEQMWQANTSEECPRIPTDIAILLLTAFNLIYGPTTVNGNSDCYIIPYFMKKHEFTLTRSDINLQSEMVFVGLSIPLYAYQQMTVRFIMLMQQPENTVHAFGNGASGRCSSHWSTHTPESGPKVFEAQLIHVPEHQKVIIRVQTDVSQVNSGWKMFLRIIKGLTDAVKTTWPSVIIRHDFTCPHCQLINDLNPEKRSNPQFIMKTIEGAQVSQSYSENCTCRKSSAIPSPLRYPGNKLIPLR